MTKRLECYLDSKGEFLAGKSTIIVLKKECDLKYILALLNSKLMSFFYSIYYNSLSLKGDFFRIGPPQIKTLPLRVPSKEIVEIIIDKSNSLQEAILNKDDKIIKIVEKELDDLIYKVYKLNEDEAN